eukprot:7375942-Prymnesium_polylepis.1
MRISPRTSDDMRELDVPFRPRGRIRNTLSPPILPHVHLHPFPRVGQVALLIENELVVGESVRDPSIHEYVVSFECNCVDGRGHGVHQPLCTSLCNSPPWHRAQSPRDWRELHAALPLVPKDAGGHGISIDAPVCAVLTVRAAVSRRPAPLQLDKAARVTCQELAHGMHVKVVFHALDQRVVS